jgi:hypothetical protein
MLGGRWSGARWLRGAAVCAALFSIGVAVSAPAASASAGWQPPVDVSAVGHTTSGVQVSVDAFGDASAVWVDASGSSSSGILVSDRVASRGVWQPPVALTRAGEDALSPTLAVDPRGDAVAVWSLNSKSTSAVEAAVKRAGGGWQQPVAVSPAGQSGFQPEVGLDGRGDAIAVWVASTGINRSEIDVSVRPAASGVWQPAERISDVGAEVSDAQVAVDGSGDAAVVWKRYVSGSALNGATYAVQAATRRGAAGGWQAPQELGDELDGPAPYAPGLSPEPHVAIDSAGDALVVWQAPGSAGTTVVQSGYKSASSAAWQTPQAVTPPGAHGALPAVTIDAAGNGIAVWMGYDGTNDMTVGAVRPTATGIWENRMTLSAPGQDNLGPQVAVDSQGNAMAIWVRANAPGYLIQAAGRPAVRGAWQQPRTISGAGDNVGAPQLAFDQLGDAVAAWEDPIDQRGTVVQAADYKTLAPAPVAITDARFAPSHFRVSATPTPIVAAARKRPVPGTTLLFTLSSPAKLTVTITAKRTGQSHGHHCQPASRPSRVGARRCVATVVLGTLVRTSEPAGSDRLMFSGRLGRRALPPGKYTAQLQATNPFGASHRVAASFRIER